ncbi:endolytic transglycosylase MltG [Candidatus Saccharibacteria bacterium]|nr:endolytic transglycosylase MltG [Candidatus Saccharibacteria bacterium]MBI3338373.1 endolytic transglycosylase MltG [Candidatus Saccharibacteria bacterium]
MRKSSQRWLRPLVVIVLTLVVLLGGAIFATRHIYLENLKPVNASQHVQQITIPSGTGIKEIGTILQDKGLIKSTWAFEWYVRFQNIRDKLQAGTYLLRSNQSVQEIVAIISQGKIKTDLVTILPGQRLDQIRQALINSGFTATNVDLALNPALYLDHPALANKPKEASLEGYLYPESFQKTNSTKVETIIRASLDEMNKHLTPELRAGIIKQGLTVHEGVILASIVDQEVNNPKDKPTVAQVFIKRFREGMMLGSDVTAFYGSIIAGKDASLTYDSPFNTHLHVGLTPGPISNVSLASLTAVANPSNTDYLYFVAGDDGITYFSRTLAEHEALTVKHCKKLCS